MSKRLEIEVQSPIGWGPCVTPSRRPARVPEAVDLAYELKIVKDLRVRCAPLMLKLSPLVELKLSRVPATN